VNFSTTIDPSNSHARENLKNAPNELLQAKPYKPLDNKTPSPTGHADPAMTTLGESRRRRRLRVKQSQGNAYRGGVRPMLRALSRLLRDEREVIECLA
jgi:hypothetical protein